MKKLLSILLFTVAMTLNNQLYAYTREGIINIWNQTQSTGTILLAGLNNMKQPEDVGNDDDGESGPIKLGPNCLVSLAFEQDMANKAAVAWNLQFGSTTINILLNGGPITCSNGKPDTPIPTFANTIATKTSMMWNTEVDTGSASQVQSDIISWAAVSTTNENIHCTSIQFKQNEAFWDVPNEPQLIVNLVYRLP